MAWPWEVVIGNLPTAAEIAAIPPGMLMKTSVQDDDSIMTSIVPITLDADPQDVEQT